MRCCYLCFPHRSIYEFSSLQWAEGRMTVRDPAVDQMSMSSCDQTWRGGGLVIGMWHEDGLELPDETSQVQKLICLSICLKAARADGGGVIVLSVIGIATVIFFFVSHGYGGHISQHIFTALCLSLSCFRLPRQADNWMKIRSCIGRCASVCVCMWDLKPGRILWAISRCLWSSVDS